MWFIFGMLGLMVGGGIGGFWGAILLGGAGVWFGLWIKRANQEPRESTARPAGPASGPEPELQDFDSLRAEVLALREQVERLEGAKPPTADARAPEPAPAPEAEPSRAAVFSPPEIHSEPVALTPAPAPAPQPEPMPREAPEAAAAARSEPIAPPAPEAPSFVSRLLSGNIVAKVGVLILFIGVGFLLKFAYDRGLLPPELRLLGVAAGAAALFGAGWWLRERRRLYGLILQGAASGLAYMDVFFALKTYGFIGPVAGFTLFSLLGVATTAIAVRQDSRTLAVLGLGGAFLSPVLASTGAGNHVLLFSYYLLLNLFILAVSWFRAWRELNLTGWGFTFVIGLFWGKANYRPELFASVEPFVLAFFAIYLLVPILFATRQPPKLKGWVDGTLVFGTPAAVAFMQAELVRGMPYGLAWSATLAAGLYAVLTSLVWRRDNMRLLAETYAALAIGLGTLAIFFAFDAYPTFALWTIEGAALLWVGLRQNHALARAFAVLVQLAGAALFIFKYGTVVRAHPVLNDIVYGCLLIAVASVISSRLLHRYAGSLREWEKLLSGGLLLWAMLWWSVGGLDALYHGVARGALPNAAALFFLGTFAAAELAGRWRDWSALRNLAGFHPIVLALVLLYQFDLNQHPLGGVGALAWPLGLALAFWTLRRQERDGAVIAQPARYVALWTIFGLAATWEEWWLLQHREHLYGMLLALAGHVAAYLRHALRERDAPRASPFSLLVTAWSMAFWYGQAYAWGEAHWDGALLAAAMLGLVAASTLAYELAGRALGWLGLRQMAVVLWVAMPLVFAAQLALSPHPFASLGWLAWPAAAGAAYLILFSQERSGAALLTAARHAVVLWLVALIAGLELRWLFQLWGFGAAWQSAAWSFAAAAALAAAVALDSRERWPVAPNRAGYRVAVLGPVGALALLWALYMNLKNPGSMAPLPYLPLLNPVDAGVAASLWAAWRWSRWFTGDAEEISATLRKAAGALGFLWLNGVALRSIHFWADVPYSFGPLFQSVLVQATLSLLWTAAAMALMFHSRRSMERGLWIAGAVLLGAVVVKLFLVDLANSGTVARIVTFIGVGGLLLVIGYLAPVPPGEKPEQDERPG